MNLDDFMRGYWNYTGRPMPKDEQDDILRMNLTYNGKQTELVIIMEELSELIQQVSKKYRGEGRTMHLLEEVADVYICLEELKLITGISDSDINAAMSVKYERMRRKLEKKTMDAFDLHEHSGLLE